MKTNLRFSISQVAHTAQVDGLLAQQSQGNIGKTSARPSHSGRRKGSSTSQAAKPERQPCVCFAVALSLAVGLLIAPYSRSYDLVLLIFPLMYLAETSQRRDRWLFAVGTLSFFLLPLTSFSVITSLMFVILLLLKSKKNGFLRRIS
jgi:hypothetical protein